MANPFNPTTQVANAAAALNPGFQYQPGQAYQTIGGVQYDNAGDPINKAPAADTSWQDTIKQQNDRINALLNQVNSTPKAAYFDIAGNYAKARSTAENAVNPVYQKKLNDFVARQQVELGRQQADIGTQKTNLDQALQDALDASNVNRDRTTADVGSNIANIQNQDQNYQADTGQQFNTDRNALAGNLAQSGLTTSGLGAQQQNQQIQNRNTQEGRQTEAFKQQQDAQNLLKSRTFEDLLKSDTIGQRNTGQAKGQLDINLNRYIEDQAYNLDTQKQSLETSRNTDILGQQSQAVKNQFLQFLSTIKNPGTANATAQTYGGLL